ncbi:MAG: hypothetical protein B6D65_06170 [candidate division Zixibacteria bacterium 4484_93]|nr:MAG: hypothetical protein B6D65_06170 [candidate division Zixibacteria bacterium 4484_93]
MNKPVILFLFLILSFPLFAQDGAPVSKAYSPGIFSQLLLDTTGLGVSFGLPLVWRYEEFSVPEYDEFSDKIADNVYYGDGNLFYNISFEGYYVFPSGVKPSIHLYYHTLSDRRTERKLDIVGTQGSTQGEKIGSTYFNYGENLNALTASFSLEPTSFLGVSAGYSLLFGKAVNRVKLEVQGAFPVDSLGEHRYNNSTVSIGARADITDFLSLGGTYQMLLADDAVKRILAREFLFPEKDITAGILFHPGRRLFDSVEMNVTYNDYPADSVKYVDTIDLMLKISQRLGEIPVFWGFAYQPAPRQNLGDKLGIYLGSIRRFGRFSLGFQTSYSRWTENLPEGYSGNLYDAFEPYGGFEYSGEQSRSYSELGLLLTIGFAR